MSRRMGQALRRATGKLHRPPPPPPPPHPPPESLAKKMERPSPVRPSAEAGAAPAALQDQVGVPVPDNISDVKDETGVLEERDPGYDAMLNKMVGRITSKPGGKLEMGEAYIVEKYNRPMPKLRSSKADTGVNEQKTSPGTLTAVQLQEIILLHQGKSEEYKGSMEVKDIAEKFRINTAHVESIIQFLSMPPENSTKNDKPENNAP